MQRSSFREMNCSIGQSLEVVGEWWSLLIIRDAFMGVTRFGGGWVRPHQKARDG